MVFCKRKAYLFNKLPSFLHPLFYFIVALYAYSFSNSFFCVAIFFKGTLTLLGSSITIFHLFPLKPLKNLLIEIQSVCNDVCGTYANIKQT